MRFPRLIVNSNCDRCKMVTLIDVENLFQLLYSDCRPKQSNAQQYQCNL